MDEKVTISKKEYDRLLRCEKVDKDLLIQLAKSINDIKNGKIERIY
jgi:hypothetical protein